MARKTLYVTNEDVLNRLKDESNESRYVTNLILKDLEANPKITEKDILELIRKYIKQEKNNPQIDEDE